MPANTAPIYSALADVQVGGSILGPTAVTAQDGTGSLVQIFQAGANGSFVDSIILKAAGSPAASVARVFFCSATGAFTSGTTNTAANTACVAEASLAAVTLSQTAASNDVVIPIRRAIPANTKLLIGFGTSTGAAGTGYSVVTFGGDY